jgi:hypothetical protein
MGREKLKLGDGEVSECTVALWRRPLRRQRADLWAHVPQTTRPDNGPESGQQSAEKATRDGRAARVATPAVHQRRAGALAVLASADCRLTALALQSVTSAQPPDATPCARLRSVLGGGPMVARGLR